MGKESDSSCSSVFTSGDEVATADTTDNIYTELQAEKSQSNEEEGKTQPEEERAEAPSSDSTDEQAHDSDEPECRESDEGGQSDELQKNWLLPAGQQLAAVQLRNPVLLVRPGQLQNSSTTAVRKRKISSSTTTRY